MRPAEQLFISSDPTKAWPHNLPFAFHTTLPRGPLNRCEAGRRVEGGLVSLWVDKASVPRRGLWAIKSNLVERGRVPSGVLDVFHLSEQGGSSRGGGVRVTQESERWQIDFVRPFYQRVCWDDLVANGLTFELWSWSRGESVVASKQAVSTVMQLNVKEESEGVEQSLTLDVQSDMMQASSPPGSAHFTFPLPRPWQGGGRVYIHSLHLPGALVSKDASKCSVSVEDERGNIRLLGNVDNWVEGGLGVVSNLRKLLEPVQLTAQLNGRGHVIISMNKRLADVQSLHFSPALKTILGFEQGKLALRGTKVLSASAQRPIDLSAGRQHDFLILCMDIVRPCLFVDRRWIHFVKHLSLGGKKQGDSSAQHFLYGAKHEPVELQEGYFNRIQLSLLDGDTLEPVYFVENTTPTRLMLTLEK